MDIWKILMKSIMLTPTFINGYSVAEEIDGKNSMGAYNDNVLHISML